MRSLKLDITIPLANNAGHVHLALDIPDVSTLSADDRAFFADTVGEVCAFAGHALAPLGTPPLAPPPVPDEAIGDAEDTTPAPPDERPPAQIWNPDSAVLNGLIGKR